MKYVFWCSNEQRQFRLAELDALVDLLGFQFEWIERSSSLPWVVLELAGEKEAAMLLSRSVSIKFGFELWAEGGNMKEFLENLHKVPVEDHAALFSEEVTFKMQVEVFNKKLSGDEKVARIESLLTDHATALPFRGTVNLAKPDVTLCYLEFWGLEQHRPQDLEQNRPQNLEQNRPQDLEENRPQDLEQDRPQDLEENRAEQRPERLMLGRKVGEGRRESITKLSIKTRKFIGNTTMDPELSLLMANMAQVSGGSLVLDPFVGTGSLLIAAAEFGGLVLGADIDYLTLHARSRPSRVGQKVRAVDESMSANFRQYGLDSRYLGVIAGDSSRPPWRPGPWLDCIVTDPPYGIRETTYKVGTEKDFSGQEISLKDQWKENHIPEKVSYSLYHLLVDLLQFAASHLRQGGRLVYWLPVIRQVYTPEIAPAHPCLALRADCEQVLSSHSSRRLIVMERLSGEVGDSRPTVDPRLGDFKEQFMLPVSSVMKKKERKERVKQHGHLNLSQEEMAKMKGAHKTSC